MPDQPKHVQTVSVLSSYVPRQCGIATFAKDLSDALAGEIGRPNARVLAMDDGVEAYAYPPEVHYQINQQRIGDYVIAAETLNNLQVDAAIIQHEYGIFGGRDGAHVLSFARALRMPLIATLHTVLTEPSITQRQTLRELVRVCDRVVVMSHKARLILQDVWGVPKHRIAYIPHGVPDVPFVDPHYFCDQFNTVGRRVMLTFGLIGPGKGIETAIRALPAIVEKHPDILYIILGATHPHVLRNEGNRYRESLEALVAELGLQNHVRFENRYVSTPDLMKFLGVTDVYVIPYPNAAQITSGTLAYAVGAGKAVVSTPFWHAEELLEGNRGLLYPFNDYNALADNVLHLLDHEHERHAIRKRAYKFARPMVWKRVAQSYLALIDEVMAERRTGAGVVVRPGLGASLSSVNVDLSHFRRLSDDVGMLQHAIGATPDRRHGYCVDDNARALIAALIHTRQTGDTSLVELADRYLSFLHFAFNEQTGRFRNFMDYARTWMENQGSEDSHGRAIWALGAAVRWSLSDSMRAVSAKLVASAMLTAEHLISPRAWAFSMIGLHHYLQYYTGDTHARRIYETLADRLYGQFASNAAPDWPWLEDLVTYDNAKLCHALILAGEEFGRDDMRQQGITSLRWLVEQQVEESGIISLIGNDGWLARDGRRARFDQQPVEAMALVEACVEAGRSTGVAAWYDCARQMIGWFTGSNDLTICLIDPDTGGCADGLHPAGSSLNQGAESTLAWIIAALTLAEVDVEEPLINPRESVDTSTTRRSDVLQDGEAAGRA